MHEHPNQQLATHVLRDLRLRMLTPTPSPITKTKTMRGTQYTQLGPSPLNILVNKNEMANSLFSFNRDVMESILAQSNSLFKFENGK